MLMQNAGMLISGGGENSLYKHLAKGLWLDSSIALTTCFKNFLTQKTN